MKKRDPKVPWRESFGFMSTQVCELISHKPLALMRLSDTSQSCAAIAVSSYPQGLVATQNHLCRILHLIVILISAPNFPPQPM